MEAKLKDITETILQLMAKNDEAPELEKIDRSEFVIDLNERDRLLSETEHEINAIRRDYELTNTKKKILRSRLIKEVWDSMSVVGQSIKSFKPASLTGRLLEITNYPIRKKSKAEEEKIERIKRLRRVQMMISSSAHVQDVAVNADNGEDGTMDAKIPVEEVSESMKLLFHDFDLTTTERRRMQSFILGECILEIKASFQKKFQEMLKAKKDEISRIEEKNERVTAILSQLQAILFVNPRYKKKSTIPN